MSIIDLRICRTIGLYKIKSSNGNKMGLRAFVVQNTKENLSLLYLRHMSFSDVLRVLLQRNIKFSVLDYFGELPDTMILSTMKVGSRDIGNLKSKVVRSRDKFLPIIKDFYPTLNINAIKVADGGIVYDNPYLYLNGNIVCTWVPTFQDVPTSDLIRLDREFIIYSYKKPIYILEELSRRHTNAYLEETLIINTSTGKVTCTYRNVIDNRYCEQQLVFDRKSLLWVTLGSSSRVITGYKNARS